MISICVVSEILPGMFKDKPVKHARGLFEAAAVFQENPETVFLAVMTDEGAVMDFLKLFTQAVPEAKVALWAGPLAPAFEMQLMAAGAADIMSVDLSFMDLQARLEKIRQAPKRDSWRNTVDSILIVDDDPGVRNFLNIVFKNKGFETQLAESGLQAIEAVRKQKPSVVLLDMMMPGMDGLETLKKLREINPDLGVVMATGLCDETMAQKAMQLGAYAYVVKPFDLAYLEMVVMTRLFLAA